MTNLRGELDLFTPLPSVLNILSQCSELKKSKGKVESEDLP